MHPSLVLERSTTRHLHLAPEEQNSTSLVLKKCFDDNDGSQFFQTTKNGQIVHNIYKDYCLEANHPNIIMK